MLHRGLVMTRVWGRNWSSSNKSVRKLCIDCDCDPLLADPVVSARQLIRILVTRNIGYSPRCYRASLHVWDTAGRDAIDTNTTDDRLPAGAITSWCCHTPVNIP